MKELKSFHGLNDGYFLNNLAMSYRKVEYVGGGGNSRTVERTDNDQRDDRRHNGGDRRHSGGDRRHSGGTGKRQSNGERKTGSFPLIKIRSDARLR